MVDFKYGLGWKKDSLDWRDGKYRLAVPPNVKIDEKTDIDLRQFPAMQFPVYQQGKTNACVGTAIGRNVRYLMRAQGVMDFEPSVYFIYWAGREVAGEVALDDGCMIRDGFKQLARLGVAAEKDWPSRPENLKRNPGPHVIRHALEHVALTYHSVPQKLDHILSCLHHRLPVVWGATVFEFWNSPQLAKTGIVPMPHPSMAPVGGHSTIIIGWQAKEKRFIFANSWGDDWGQQGYGTIPADYVLHSDLGADFWSCFLMSKTPEEKARK